MVVNDQRKRPISCWPVQIGLDVQRPAGIESLRVGLRFSGQLSPSLRYAQRQNEDDEAAFCPPTSRIARRHPALDALSLPGTHRTGGDRTACVRPDEAHSLRIERRHYTLPLGQCFVRNDRGLCAGLRYLAGAEAHTLVSTRGSRI